MKKGKFLISFLIITAAFILIVLSLAVPRTHRKRESEKKHLPDLVVIEIKQLDAAKLVQPESGDPPLKKFEVMIKVKNQGVAPVGDLENPLKLLFYEVTAPDQVINVFLLDLYGPSGPVLSLESGETCYSTCKVVSSGTYVEKFSYDILTDHRFVAGVDPHIDFIPGSYGAVLEMNEGNNLHEEVIRVAEYRI